MNRSMAEPTTYCEAITNRYLKGMRIPHKYIREALKEIDAEVSNNILSLGEESIEESIVDSKSWSIG